MESNAETEPGAKVTDDEVELRILPPSSPSASSSASEGADGKQSREPPNGTLILSKDTEHCYVTRYRIVREKQREMIREDMLKEMAPFCLKSERSSVLRTVWQFVKSEPFLLTLHIAALLFSVLKRTIPDVEIDEQMEWVHSFLETAVAVMSLLIRIAAGYEKFHEEKVVRNEIEHCTDSVRTHTLKVMMRVFYIVGVLLISLLIGALALCIVYEQLHWTIVTTNFALIVGGIGGNVIMQRLSGMVSKIIEDQHKAVVYEAMLLLTECIETPENTSNRTQRIRKFCNSVENTELLKNKGHIHHEAGNQFIASNWNVPGLLVLQ